MSAEEQTGWRDREISERHRTWGGNAPMVDIDFLVVEYNRALPVAICDYKRSGVVLRDFSHPNYQALAALCALGDLPFYVCYYWPETWAMRVWPVNDFARIHFDDGESLTEREYVSRIYRMRRMALSKAIEPILFDEKPPPLTSNEPGFNV